MIKYEGVNIELDPHGSAMARSVNALTDVLQRQSTKDPAKFHARFETEWDAQANCEQILSSMARFPKKPDTEQQPDKTWRTHSRNRRPSAEADEEPVDKTPTTIAEIMGWGADHVPAEQTVSPIVPAKPKPEPTAETEPEDEQVEEDVPTTVANTDVVVEFGGNEVADEADEPVELEPQEQARQRLDDLVDEAIGRLDVCAPRTMTLEMLVTMARNEWMNRRFEKDPTADKVTLRLPQDEFARKNIVVNFVKHELVFPRYDDVVRGINSYNNLADPADVERCYAKWRVAVIDAISEAFPVLATTANAQRLRRYDAKTGRLVPIPGAVLPARNDEHDGYEPRYGYMG